MKSYRDSTGVFHRTQAEAKASGHPFEPVDIPTAHQELVDFVNKLVQRGYPMGLGEPMMPGDLGDIEIVSAERIERGFTTTDYQNGDPTVVVNKSRDPMARFTCKACGVVNAPAGDR